MPNPVPPPANDETYCVIICIPGPLTKDQYIQFNNQVKALAQNFTGGKVTEAKVTQSKKQK